MGYSITIGERYFYQDGDQKFTDAKDVTLENAPAYNEPTDFTNSRWPSYSAWADFSRFIGLPLYKTIGNHPGYVSVTEELKLEVDLCYEQLKQKYPNAIPGMGDKEPECNYQLARLTWLKFWIDWTLQNCKYPIIHKLHEQTIRYTSKP